MVFAIRFAMSEGTFWYANFVFILYITKIVVQKLRIFFRTPGTNTHKFVFYCMLTGAALGWR